MNLAYVRVSTADQNPDRQREALKHYHIDKWYEEKISGRDTNRPKLQELLDFAREGDTVYIMDFSRLARNTKDLLEIVDRLKGKGIHLVSVKENLDTTTPTGTLMLTMIAAINEFERANLLERQREGIAIAKTKGVYKGRQKKKIDPSRFDSAYQDYMQRKITKARMAEIVGVSRPTLDKLIKEKNHG